MKDITNLKHGTGLLKYSSDYENEFLTVDFSGDYGNQCYRNDASVFFFAANSYRSSCGTIGNSISKSFKEKASDKYLAHLILPYMFSFRHFVELELKAIYITITNTFPNKGHKINDLVQALEKPIISLNETKNMQQKADSCCDDTELLIKEYHDLQEKLNVLYELEPSSEYYRYLFINDDKFYMALKNPLLVLDFKRLAPLFLDITETFDRMCTLLNNIGVYTFNLI